MNKSLFSSTLIVLLCLIFSSSGCKDKETLKNGTFTIAETDLSKEFGSGTETIFIPVQTSLSLNDWKTETDAGWLYVSTQEEKEYGAQIKLSATANTSNERRNAVVKVLSPIQNYVINVTQYASSDLVISEDIKVIPSGGKASEFQPGQGMKIPGTANSRLTVQIPITQYGDSRPISRSHWSITSRKVPILIT